MLAQIESGTGGGPSSCWRGLLRKQTHNYGGGRNFVRGPIAEGKLTGARGISPVGKKPEKGVNTLG